MRTGSHHSSLGAVSIVVFLGLLAAGLASRAPNGPSHERPFFLPREERERILALVEREAWARADHDHARAAADKGDGHQAAFLYALHGDPRDAATARTWLLKRFGPDAYHTQRSAKLLADPSFFLGGQPGIPEVYYDVDIKGLVAFDWAFAGLDASARAQIHDGIVTQARYRMRCMDRWSQTPNLVFKPSFMVAMSGLVTGERELMDWGFHRILPWGPARGGLLEALDAMLKDGGIWDEAPIYPVAQQDLPLALLLARYGALYDGQDWLDQRTPHGGSIRGLMDYYVDTAYPPEAQGVWRVATFGDGATNAAGDLFLVGPATPKRNLLLHDSLVTAHRISGDPRYAAFLSRVPGYAPSLWDRRPLPTTTTFPPAPSHVWPEFGLAMLRSDESPSYWTSGTATAVVHLLSRGYGHDHRDKLSILLHGAGRLFYPDENAIQYENPALGWTRSSVAHNTLVVDEGDARDAPPTAIRHEFTPEVKFLASAASGVYEGVDETRGLFLTSEYLLDVFAATSAVPHTFDYVLHSFGAARPLEPAAFRPGPELERRYWLLDDRRSRRTDEPWTLDFVLPDAALRLTMAGAPGTLVTHGVWGRELARIAQEQGKGVAMDRLSTVVARREARATVFLTTHEPHSLAKAPRVKAVGVLARSADAVVAKVEAEGFTDYVGLDFGAPEPASASTLVARDASFAFKSWGYLRVSRDGRVLARGGWTALRLPGAAGPLVLNGHVEATRQASGALVFGAAAASPPPPAAERECPLTVRVQPDIARLPEHGRREIAFAVRNPLATAVSGRITFEAPAGLRVEPEAPVFGPLAPGVETHVSATLVAAAPAPGRLTIPYRVIFKPAGGDEVRAAARALVAVVGATLERLYEAPRPYYRVSAPHYTARLDMRQGLLFFLSDDAGATRLDGPPLFTLGDGAADLVFDATPQPFTWPTESPASLVATAADRCRWRALFRPDRIRLNLDPAWTRFETAHVTLPGKWISPQGPPHWRQIVAVGADGAERAAQPGARLRVAAAALAFPGGSFDLALAFAPPQEADFAGAGLSFTMGVRGGEAWSVGFCKAGELDAWRRY